MFQTSTQHDKKQGALLKIDQQSLHTIRQCEPHHASQLDKLDQPPKHLDNSTKSTFEHCKLGKRPTQETPPTLPAIVLDDLNFFCHFIFIYEPTHQYILQKIKLSTL